MEICSFMHFSVLCCCVSISVIMIMTEDMALRSLEDVVWDLIKAE